LENPIRPMPTEMAILNERKVSGKNKIFKEFLDLA
jgi:hypothetical protein